MNQLATFDEMSLEAIEVACQSAYEECELVFQAIDRKRKQLEIFGRLLTAAKAKVAHGEWENWLTDTFAGRLKVRTAQLWMAKAQKIALLESGQEQEITPRSERKTGRVAVSKSEQDEPVSKADELDENAVPPEPKNNTHHSPATAKAKEADREPPPVITPEVIDEPVVELEEKTLADWSVDELLTFLKVSADDPKKRARELRKVADELDPPKKFRPPDIEEVAAYCAERGNSIDAEAFVAFYAANGWKLSNGNKMADWKAAIVNWESRNGGNNRAGNRKPLSPADWA